MMASMNTQAVVGDNWAYVVNMLPGDMEDSAFTKLALQRRRQITCAQDLLRLCLAYGLCDLSLRQLAAWAQLTGIGSLQSTSLLKRLRHCDEWLGYLILRWMQERGLPTVRPGMGVRIVDATVLCQPRSTGTDWRLHLGLDLEQLRISSVELTGAEGGESFRRHRFAPGELAIGDRGYGHRAGVASVLDQGAHVLVRITAQTFPLLAAGAPLDLIACLELLAPGEIGDWSVAFEHDQQRHPVRLVAIGKSDEAAEQERQRLRRVARGRHRQPDPGSLRAAGFVFVITDLPASILPAAEALELYRLRWQIELSIKRLTSILNIDAVRAQDKHTVRTYIYANILGALIVDQLRQNALSFFPWGYPLRVETPERVAPVSPAH